MHQNRMLSVLLALLLAFGQVGGVYALDHGCGKSDHGSSMGSKHSTQLMMQMISNDDPVDGQLTGKCPDCSSDCCNGNVCSSHTCMSGLSAVLTRYDLPHLRHASGDFFSSDSPIALSPLPGSLFRPPRS